MTSHRQVPGNSRSTRRNPEPAWPLTTRALVCALVFSVGLLGATLACRADEPAVEKTEPEVIQVDLDAPDAGEPPVVKPIPIQRGQTVQINCRSNTVWITIPSRYFSQAGGGSDWAVGEDMITVKIDHAFARVKLSEDFPPSTEEESVFFSILYFDGEVYYYQHGESPPRMIIPPVGI